MVEGEMNQHKTFSTHCRFRELGLHNYIYFPRPACLETQASRIKRPYWTLLCSALFCFQTHHKLLSGAQFQSLKEACPRLIKAGKEGRMLFLYSDGGIDSKNRIDSS